MSRFILAFACFFRLLFTGSLPEKAVKFLPEGTAPPQLGEGEPDGNAVKAKDADGAAARAKGADGAAAKAKDADGAAARAKNADGAAAKEDAAKRDRAAAEARAKRSATLAEHHRDGALALLGLFQREGRLVDFLREDLDTYDDADIGGAVRDIHRGCKKVLEEHLKLEAVMPGEEDDAVTIPRGFDPGEVRLIGEVRGEPPFKGVLRHHGWRVADAKLPTLTEGVDRRVLAPAEVELS